MFLSQFISILEKVSELKKKLLSAHIYNTNLQQLAALLQSTLLSHGTVSHVADKDPRVVSSDHGDVVGKAGPLLRRRRGRS